MLFGVGLVITSSITAILSAVVLIILGLLFMIQLNFFLGMLAFKFLDVSPFLMIKGQIISFVTGGLIPLALFPQSIVSVMRFVPFYYVTYLPSMLGIVTLAIWLLAFTLLNKFSYNKMRVIYDGVGI